MKLGPFSCALPVFNLWMNMGNNIGGLISWAIAEGLFGFGVKFFFSFLHLCLLTPKTQPDARLSIIRILVNCS